MRKTKECAILRFGGEKMTSSEIYFAKIREGAKIPTKREEDAGFDMWACFDEEFFVIEPGETRPIPTGIATAFDSKYYAQIEERSSMAKLGIKKSGGVIDSGYRGEYLILTYNTNKVPFIISKTPIEELPESFTVGDRAYEKSKAIIYPYTKAICQMILQIVPKLSQHEISYEELCKIESERKTGGFGSTNF